MVECKDMQKMAQAMLPLMTAAWQLTPSKENTISYYLMDAGQKCYVSGPNDDNTLVLPQIFMDRRIVIDAGAKEMMAKMQATLLKKDTQASNGSDDKLKFKEKLKNFQSKASIENCGSAITIGPTIAKGQHKIALAKHIINACRTVP
jgi:hypothetical protein